METIIGAILSAIISAIIATLTTLAVEKRKEKRHRIENDNKEKKEIFENRPEYAIVDYKDYISRIGYGIKQECDLDVFLTRIIGIERNGRIDAIYQKEDFNPEEWCCVIYTLKNVGKTDISVSYIICHHKRTKVLLNSRFAKDFLDARCLNYSESCDRKIRVGETLTIKLCYHKDHVIISSIDAILSVGMRDSNGHCWEQPLFVPYNKIYDSARVSPTEFRSDILTDDAEECFQKPWLW